MKHIRNSLIISSILICFYSCGTKDCKEWYSDIELCTVTKEKTNHEKIGKFYKTDFNKNELIFLVKYIYSADGYEECKSTSMIHSILKDSTIIYCSNSLIIGKDTIQPNENIYKYFKLSDYTGYSVYEFDTISNQFPKFNDSNNMFKLILRLSDNQILVDSCIIRLE